MLDGRPLDTLDGGPTGVLDGGPTGVPDGAWEVPDDSPVLPLVAWLVDVEPLAEEALALADEELPLDDVERTPAQKDVMLVAPAALASACRLGSVFWVPLVLVPPLPPLPPPPVVVCFCCAM